METSSTGNTVTAWTRGWRTMRLEHIRTEKDRLIVRIISNTVRRSVPRREKTELLAKLGGLPKRRR